MAAGASVSGGRFPVVAAEYDPDESADRHAVARCRLLDNGELLEEGAALARRHPFEKKVITCSAVAKLTLALSAVD